MKMIVVVSPFRETKERSREAHLAHAKLLCRRLALAGNSVFASHVSYPLFLDEDSPAERRLGLDLECEHIRRCDELAVWDVWGISSGMQGSIDFAAQVNGRRGDGCPGCLTHDPIVIRYFSKGEVPEWDGLHSNR